MADQQFSVVLTTYANDDPDELRTSLESVVDQTVVPDEIVIIKDGPVPEPIEATIETFRREHSAHIAVYALSENCGHGKALQIGVERCSHDLVAIMDADDISVKTRFEQQLSYLKANPNIDLVGGYIAEFSEDSDSPHAVREVPLTPEAIRDKGRFRSPVNQTTVMFRREAVLAAGNYREVDRMEDYDLWARLIADGASLANIPEVLAKVRAGTDMHARRGGLEYAREEIRQQLTFLRIGFVSLPVCIANICIRVPVRLIPNQLRSTLYKSLLRDYSETTDR